MAQTQALSEAEREELVAFLDGELNPEAAREMESRLASDPRYRLEIDALGKTWQLLDYLPQQAASPAFTSRTLERASIPTSARPTVAARPTQRPWWKPYALAAAWAAAMLIAALAGYTAMTLYLKRASSAVVLQADPPDFEERMARDLRIIENRRLYELVDDLGFLRALDDPELFGDEG